jgi:hypothetical protein
MPARGAHLRAARNRRSGPVTYKFIPRKGHEQVSTEQIYIHADMTLKERAIARITPPTTRPGRYHASDAMLAFLEGL